MHSLLFAKCHPRQGYVQGMSDLLAPFFYVFATDPDVSFAEAEADTFFCFSTLMSECGGVFHRCAAAFHVLPAVPVFTR